MKEVIWRLKKGEDRRFKSGHPWVYSNELQESPKGIDPGAPIALHDPGGTLLARGYGNPGSLIAFRAVSRTADETDALAPSGIRRRLESAARLRARLGLGETSHRLVFGEADRLPGLVIDRYVLDARAGQVLVVQAHTAGIDRLLPELEEILSGAVASSLSIDWARTSVVIRNDVGVRKLEGLASQEPRVLRLGSGVTEPGLRDARILVPSASGAAPIAFACDLVEGQKTGFFLDQSANVQAVARRFSPMFAGAARVRVLDLCSYVSQWGTQLSRAFLAAGAREVEVTAVDASAKALEFARRNLESQGARATPLKGDVLRDLADMEGRSFDVVIADPPALIKGRKDIPQGTHAYLQLNTQALRLLKAGGGIVSCSCSALFAEPEFVRTVGRAANRAGTPVRWIGRASQGPDHPELAEFPEGRYLKGIYGVHEE